MKYDRPVWELMADCARELPPRFRFKHVQQWFVQHYPDVNERTVRVHLVGLTESERNSNAFLADKTPLFRRVEHGEYEVIGDAAAPPAGAARIVLIGATDQDGEEPVAARALGRSDGAAAAVRAAAAGDAPWFVLSAAHGLLAPGAWAVPSPDRLDEQTPAYRDAWTAWVLARLEAECGDLADREVELATDDELTSALREPLRARGARPIPPA